MLFSDWFMLINEFSDSITKGKWLDFINDLSISELFTDYS